MNLSHTIFGPCVSILSVVLGLLHVGCFWPVCLLAYVLLLILSLKIQRENKEVNLKKAINLFFYKKNVTITGEWL